ncbi:flagellar hook-associated protein FlgK [Evansella sp. LMS18]|uniref:flagellar hook-associated protein FlgK n=1 Tax=Evansella sp. LMS18 TaxID=2924033 RepID=UPI0020D1D91D|nr:flagellar hook-associated protein FlgK [Evansella sp. LMS18]UTR11783.1 flagellar hook-associated protein FlgK [Evansella sp. LMS18]
MTSTFHGLETARRALATQQAALHTTGHNIANANTPGYTRQRVNFTQTEAFPSPSFNKPGIPGQIGTGVKAGEIQRVREAFLDTQLRTESNKHGYWEGRHTALHKMEDIMNEPTENGLANTMDRFWQSLQDLAVHPEDSGARSVVRERGIALAETFNHTYESLEAIQRDYQNQIGVQTNKVNSLLTQINNINKQIAGVEPHGYLANDLYDQRDLLVDELSQYINIKVEQVGSGGLSKEVADGRYTIKLLNDEGKETGFTLVDGRSLESNEIHFTYAGEDGSGPVNGIFIAPAKIMDDIDHVNELHGDSRAIFLESMEDFNSPGKLWATIEAYGYNDKSGNEKGLYPDMMKELDLMAATFAAEFNAVHSTGWSMSEIEEGTKSGYNFFAFAEVTGQPSINPDTGNIAGAAKRLMLHSDMEDLNNIAASGAARNGVEREEAFSGDGSNALALAGVKDATLNFGSTRTNIQTYYQGVIGEMAVKTNEAERMTKNTAVLKDSVEERRQSVSGVSLDEEMSNLIQFQHAYNAAARNITTVDEMLDRIINGMGVVGR